MKEGKLQQVAYDLKQTEKYDMIIWEYLRKKNSTETLYWQTICTIVKCSFQQDCLWVEQRLVQEKPK